MGSWLAVSIGVGVAIAVQVAVLGRASRNAHPLTVSLALQIAGLIVGMIWGLSQNVLPHLPMLAMKWWWLPLGALGWGIIAALGFAVGRGGVAGTLAVVVAAQLLSGLALDKAAGNITLGGRHLLGGALLVAGVVLISVRQ